MRNMMIKKMLLNQGKWKTVEGVPLTGVPFTLEDSKYGRIKDYKISGNSIQDGEPTPEAPIQIESVGEITKNLIPINNYDLTGTVLNTVIFNGNLSLPATFSWDIDYTPNNSAALFEFVVDGTTKYVGASYGKYYITGTALTQIKIVNWGQDVGKVTNIQLEYGYGCKIPIEVKNGNEEITTNIYLDEPLRKVGNYVDCIEYENKKIVRQIAEVTFDGSEAWLVVGNGETSYFALAIGEYGYIVTGEALCSHFTYNYINSSNKDEGIYVFNSSGYNNARIAIRPGIADITTRELWKEYLAEQYKNGTPLTVCYILTEPIEENIELPEIFTFAETSTTKTTINLDTSIKPSNLSVTYRRK